MPLEKLRGAFAGGTLSPTDYVWREGWPEWRPASDVAELAGTTEAAEPWADAVEAESATSRSFASASWSASISSTPPLPATAAPVPTRALEYGSARGGSGDVVATTAALDALRATRPWVTLFAVLLFIGVGFGALFVLVLLIAAVAGGGARAGGVAILFALFACGGLCLYFFPALYLIRYSAAIGRLGESRRPEDLEAALVSQKSFWKFLGILFCVSMAINLLGFLLVGLLGVAVSTQVPTPIAPAAPSLGPPLVSPSPR